MSIWSTQGLEDVTGSLSANDVEGRPHHDYNDVIISVAEFCGHRRITIDWADDYVRFYLTEEQAKKLKEQL